VTVNVVINRKLLTLGEKRIAKDIWLDRPPLQNKIQTQAELFMGLVVEKKQRKLLLEVKKSP